MYGDTAAIRRLATEQRERATDIRAEGRALRARIGATTWDGLGAEAMRSRAEERLRGLEGVAARHERAGEALDHHAGQVDLLRELIASIEHRALGWLADGLDGALGLPPPGHLDWLHVDLPWGR